MCVGGFKRDTEGKWRVKGLLEKLLMTRVDMGSSLLGAPRNLQAPGPETDSMTGSLKEESGTKWQKCGLFLYLSLDGGALEVQA